jgi:dTDP-4-amino-4,6-dideoxygalactose transaminase
MKIEFCKHNIIDEDIKSAYKVMNSTFLTTGPKVAEFEKRFAQYLEIQEAIGLTSCTGALYLALMRNNIRPGDEVITTPMTFVATATAILEAGAIPKFVDVCPKSGLLLPNDVESALNEKTKAILPVHLYGRMVDMIGFKDICNKYGLVLIEDAAHCIEGKRDGIRPGQLSNAACFSFYATKNMTCGEGGALICRSSEDAAWYRSARHHGISKNASLRYSQKYKHWDMEMMGWKYNMDDIQAALLLNQIDRLSKNIKRRQEIDSLYRLKLSDIEELDLMEQLEPDELSGHHLFTVQLPRIINRDDVLHKLQEYGIGCAVNYRAIHTLSYFRETFGYKANDFPVAYDFGNRTITLPLYPSLSEEEVIYICEALKTIICKK